MFKRFKCIYQLCNFSFCTFSFCALWRFFNQLLICCLVSWKNSLSITDGKPVCHLCCKYFSYFITFLDVLFCFCAESNFYIVKSIIFIFSHFLLLYYKSCFQTKLHKLITLIQCDKQYSRRVCPIPIVWKTQKAVIKMCVRSRINLFLLCSVS